MDQKLLTPQEIAERLSVPLSWVYGQTRRRDPAAIPHLKIGKYCRFVESEVIKWLQSRQEK